MTATKFDIPVTSLAEVPKGEGRAFYVAGERVAIFHTRTGQVFATQAECPHKRGPLADGLLGGATLLCPLHSWKFDLTTGEAQGSECRLKTYPVQVDESGRILLSILTPSLKEVLT